MLRDAVAVNVVLLLLFVRLMSPVDEVTVAVLMIAPFATGSRCTTSENVALAPEAKLAMVQLTVPAEPAAGVVQLKGVPAVCVAETNVVFAGNVSASVTFAAVAGPLFVTTIV